jgi:hypothetical protein
LATSTTLNFPTAEEKRNRIAVSNIAKLAQSPPRRSSFTGVDWKRDGKWDVSISHGKKKMFLGTFALEEEEAAARAYDNEARQLRGSEAHSSTFKLNFPTAEEQRNQSHPQLAGEEANLYSQVQPAPAMDATSADGYTMSKEPSLTAPFAQSFATEDEVQAVLFAASSADSNVPETIRDELADIDALQNEEAQVDRQLVKLQQTMSQMPADPANAVDAWMTHEDICQVRKRIFCAILH